MFQLLGNDFTAKIKKVNHKICRRFDVVVRASASQLVDLGLIYLVESYQKTLFKGSLLGAQLNRDGVENKLACCILGQDT